MQENKELRIDKWLWAVRVFKSRSLAADACNGGKVKIDGVSVKPSKHIRPGEVVTVQSGYVKKTYKVLGLLERRVSAKVVAGYVQDITPDEDKMRAEAGFRSYISRYKGSGRPTKKERRLLDKLRF